MLAYCQPHDQEELVLDQEPSDNGLIESLACGHTLLDGDPEDAQYVPEDLVADSLCPCLSTYVEPADPTVGAPYPVLVCMDCGAAVVLDRTPVR